MARKRRILACSALVAATAGLLWTLRPARGSEFAEAFEKATRSPWRNPVVPVERDPREEPDVRRLLDSDEMVVYTSEYFPGWVFSSKGRELTLFHRLPQVWRVGGPTRLAFSAAGRAEVFGAGEEIPPQKLSSMDKPWILVWFAGARNWDRFDLPVLVVLQHRPTGLTFKDDLRLRFPRSAGVVVMMNLYGYYRPPQDNRESRRFADAPGRAGDGPFDIKLGPLAPTNVRPYEWRRSLPGGVVQRCDFFAGLARAVPTFLRDTFQLDLAENSLRIRYDVSYLETADDWRTEPRKLAPVSPSFALAARYGLPVKFDGEVFDPCYPATVGPWAGILDRDRYEVSIEMLQHLTETYVVELNRRSDDPLVRKAIEVLTGEAPGFCLDARPFPYGSQQSGYSRRDEKAANFCWGSITCDRTKAIAMRFVPAADLDRARGNMRNFFEYSYFTDSGYREQEIGGRTFHYRHDAGIGGDCFGDAGKLVMDTFLTGWLYAYHGRDYGWIAPKVEAMEKMASTLAQLGWARAGRMNIAEMGDEAGPAMGFARLMYAARDQSRFAWGAYMAVMELVQVFNKCGPMGEYARRFQPWHRYERMDDTENATDCNGGSFGWAIGGPGREPIGRTMKGGHDVAPYQRHGTGQWVARWRCMADFDVDRFFREQCAETPGGLRFEFDTWLERDFPDLGPRASYPDDRRSLGNQFKSPAKVLSLCKQMLGESVREVRARMKGWDMSWRRLFGANWNWEPAPWIYWALADGKRYERIMKAEKLPWTPGLRSVYASQRNDLVWSTGHLGQTDDVTKEPLLPFPQTGRWYQPARPKGSAWGLGFITADPAHRLASAESEGPATRLRWSREPVEPDPYEVALEGKGWRFALDPRAQGIRSGWQRPAFDDSSWASIEVPGLWERQGWGNEGGKTQPKGVFPPEIKANSPPNYTWPYDGTAWYRIRVTVPKEFGGRPVFFHAGIIDDFDMVWVNGVQVGRTDASTTKTWWRDTRLYPVPQEALRIGGRNVIAVMVCDNNSGGGIAGGPVRLIAKRGAVR